MISERILSDLISNLRNKTTMNPSGEINPGPVKCCVTAGGSITMTFDLRVLIDWFVPCQRRFPEGVPETRLLPGVVNSTPKTSTPAEA